MEKNLLPAASLKALSFFAAVSAVISFTDTLWYGRFIHYRTI